MRKKNRAYQKMRTLLLVIVRITCVIIIVFLSTSCDGNKRKKISNTGYYLLYFPENKKYYLFRENSEETGVGCVDGTVKYIGYNNNHILVLVESNIIVKGSRLPDEAYIISIDDSNISKIEISDIPTNSKVKDISLMKIQDYMHLSAPPKAVQF
jgi:hypothetical protein